MSRPKPLQPLHDLPKPQGAKCQNEEIVRKEDRSDAFLVNCWARRPTRWWPRTPACSSAMHGRPSSLTRVRAVCSCKRRAHAVAIGGVTELRSVSCRTEVRVPAKAK